jgi:hypothetical protein
MRPLLLALLSVAVGAACAGMTSVNAPPPSDEPTRLEQTMAVALRDRDSLTLDRFIAPAFELLSADRTAPPIPRDLWLSNSLKAISLDSVAVREVTGQWSGDTLTTQFWMYYRGKAGDQPLGAEEARLEDRWLLAAARWQLLSRRTLEIRPIQADSTP